MARDPFSEMQRLAGIPRENREDSEVLDEAAKKKLSPGVIEMARAFSDAWSETGVLHVAAIEPKALTMLVALAKKDSGIQKALTDLVERVIPRNLDWRGSEWMTSQQYVEAAKVFVPGYNAFDPAMIGSWLAKATGVQIQAAREGSPAIYIKGPKDQLDLLASTAEQEAAADEVSMKGDELRVWWD